MEKSIEFPLKNDNATFHVQCDKLLKEQIPKSSLDKGKSLVLNISGKIFTLTKPKEDNLFNYMHYFLQHYLLMIFTYEGCHIWGWNFPGQYFLEIDDAILQLIKICSGVHWLDFKNWNFVTTKTLIRSPHRLFCKSKGWNREH